MGETLGRLITDLGERSSFDAASQCSRCGYCEQACPTYVATGREAFSARGRNQLVKLMLSGGLKDPEAAKEALSTCLLCGACSSACYAHVPTADIVLEGRRRLSGRPPALARFLIRLLVEQPARLESLLKLANLAKRLGLSRLARPFLRWAGLSALAEADAHVEEAPLTFLAELLRARGTQSRPRWSYFAACGTNYLFPRVGLATIAALEPFRGPAGYLDAGCCGLVCYNYGELEDARILARKVIARHEAAGAPPVVVDCSSCAAFLKAYPQLFTADPPWRGRAQRFAAEVEDAVEALAEAPVSGKETAAATYHQSCRACHGQGVKPPKEWLERACGEAFRELPESDVCCGGAGAFAFVNPELSDEVLRRKVSRIAETRAEVVLTSSTSCLIQLARGLKKYYPQGRVMHLSELAASLAVRDNPDGAKTRA